jgi:hypothetical protein
VGGQVGLIRCMNRCGRCRNGDVYGFLKVGGTRRHESLEQVSCCCTGGVGWEVSSDLGWVECKYVYATARNRVYACYSWVC